MRVRKVHIVSLILLSILPLSTYNPHSLSGQTQQQINSLLTTYSPLLVFSSGEKFYPVTVGYFVNSSTLKQRSGSTVTVVDNNPTVASLNAYTDASYYLDNKFLNLDAIASDYTQKTASLGELVYARYATAGSQIALQYWFFYAFNNGPLDDHEGDWEVVSFFLDQSNAPQYAFYSQHFSGEKAAWSDVEKSADGHPVVYVALGSHANYYRAYQGKVGFESDQVSNDGLKLNPLDYSLEILGSAGSSNHPASQNWLDFGGRWGYVGSDAAVAAGTAGPLGPVYNQDGMRWNNPVGFASSGNTADSNSFLLDWIAANFLLLFFAYFAIRAAWKIYHLAKAARRRELTIRQAIRTRIGVSILLVAISLVFLAAALFLPWYLVTLTTQTTGSLDIVKVNGIQGVLITVPVINSGYGGTRTVANAVLPFSIIFAAGIVLTALDMAGMRSSTKLRRKFIVSGILGFIPIILILIFVFQFGAIVTQAANYFGAQVPPEIATLGNQISSKPVSGSSNLSIGQLGQASFSWGFGIGAYLIILAAIIRIVAGILARSTETPKPPQTENQSTPSSKPAA